MPYLCKRSSVRLHPYFGYYSRSRLNNVLKRFDYSSKPAGPDPDSFRRNENGLRVPANAYCATALTGPAGMLAPAVLTALTL